MYNDTIKAANKIITDEDLIEIFSLMNENIIHYQKISKKEQIKNNEIPYSERTWTFKDNESKLKFNVNFYDDTVITFDNYNNFITIFNTRLHEIKHIEVIYKMSYSKKEYAGQEINYFYNSIIMYIYENKMRIELSLNSKDRTTDAIYNFIKKKILSAPEKYDNVIRKKKKINTIVGLTIGFIPALIITTLLLFVPVIRNIFAESYVLYPICCLFLAFFIGTTLGANILDNLYKNISPSKKYAGYDWKNNEKIFKDDMETYLSTSEILIGKNVDNVKNRNRIMEYYNKYKKILPFELLLLIIISIIVLFLGKN